MRGHACVPLVLEVRIDEQITLCARLRLLDKHCSLPLPIFIADVALSMPPQALPSMHSATHLCTVLPTPSPMHIALEARRPRALLPIISAAFVALMPRAIMCPVIPPSRPTRVWTASWMGTPTTTSCASSVYSLTRMHAG